MRPSALLAPALLLALPACGGDDGGPPLAPAIIAGGGIHDPGIDGVVNVYVIDADDGAALAGATVEVGGVDLTTDATGLAIFDGVTGPQTIAAKATGHATALWVGADGGNVTIPLERSPADATRPPQAQLTGTIAGWDALPQPDLNHTLVALITFSQDPELGARVNDIKQPPSMGNLPPSSCLRVRGPLTPCAWKLNARAGAIALGLQLIDVDNRGTGDPGDDGFITTGYSVTPITVVAGMNQSGVMLVLPAVDSGVRPTVDLGTPPAALTQVAAAVGLELGAAGVWRIGGVDPSRPGVLIPGLSVAAGSSYELLGLASEPVADGTAAQSLVLRRGIADPTTFALGAWPEPPTALASDRTSVSFTRGGAGGLYAVELTNDGLGVEGRPVITIAIFDGTSQVALPTTFSPLPRDPLRMKVTSLDAGAAVDLRNFEVGTVTDHLAGAASDTVTVP